MSDRRRFERALDLRERGLGHDHPLTHASRLNLAMILREQGDRRRAQALLAVVVRATTPDKSTVLALRELAMDDGRRGRWSAAAEALAEASRLAHELLDPARDRWLIDETRILYAHAAAYSGDYPRAEAAFLRAQDMDVKPLIQHAAVPRKGANTITSVAFQIRCQPGNEGLSQAGVESKILVNVK